MLEPKGPPGSGSCSSHRWAPPNCRVAGTCSDDWQAASKHRRGEHILRTGGWLGWLNNPIASNKHSRRTEIDTSLLLGRGFSCEIFNSAASHLPVSKGPRAQGRAASHLRSESTIIITGDIIDDARIFRVEPLPGPPSSLSNPFPFIGKRD